MRTFQFGNSKEEVYEAFPERKIKTIKVGEKRLALLRNADVFYVFDSFCPHRGADLSQSSINGAGEIICPLHQYRFDLKTGDVRSGFCPPLPIYRYELTAGGLKLFIT